jgi:protein-tyrosine-phosphatase/predicted ATP-grasp superfamily ATP-dependent carboligase
MAMQSKPDAPPEAGAFDSMASKASRHVALVIGSDMRAFLGVVRSLGRQGVTVHVAPFDFTSPALHSRFIARLHRLPSLQAGVDATEGAALWVAALSELCDRIRPDFIVPCDDRSIIPLQLHARKFSHLRIALPGRDAFEAFFDKGNTRALAQSCGVPVASGKVLSAADTAESLVSAYGLPLYVKPRNSYLLHSIDRRREVVPCHDVGRLRAVLAAIEAREEYIVEGHQPGTGVGVSVLARDGEVSQIFQHRRVRERTGGGGSTYRVSERPDPALRRMVCAMAAASRLSGVAMFEFKVDDGAASAALLEVNARFWGSLPLAMACGVDFPWLWMRQALGAPPLPPIPYGTPYYARNPVADIYATRAHISSLRAEGRVAQGLEAVRWLSSLVRIPLGRECLDTLPRDDRRPGWTEIRGLRDGVLRRLRRPSASNDLPAAVVVAEARRAAGTKGRTLRLVAACWGNICRSPYAALRLREALRISGPDVDVTGAALGGRQGRPCPAAAIAASARRGLDLGAHRSHFADESLLETADLVIVFDRANLDLLASRGIHLRRPAVLLRRLLPEDAANDDIADPIGGDDAVFDSCYSLIDRGVDALVANLRAAS